MDNFNLAPTATGTPYNPTAYIQAQAQARQAAMPQLPAVPALNLPQIPELVQPGQGPADAKSPWTQLLETVRPKNIQEYTQAADYFKNSILPQATARHTEDARIAEISGFEALVAQQGPALFPGQAVAIAPTEAASDPGRNWGGLGRTLKDFAVGADRGFGTAINALVGLGGKGIEAVTGNADNFLSRDAQRASRELDANYARNASAQTQQAEQQFGLDRARDGGAINTLNSLGQNAAMLPGLVGNVVGQMVPTIAAGAVGATAKLGQLTRLGLQGIAGGATAAGATGVSGEVAIKDTPIDQLVTQNPFIKDTYAQQIASGASPEEAATIAKAAAIQRVWRIEAPTSGAANALGSIFGVESTLAKTLGKTGEVASGTARKLGGRIAVGAGVEAASEAVPGVIETTGRNIAQGQDLSKDVAGDFALNAVLGAAIGGPVEGVFGKRPVGKAKAKATPDASTGSPDATQTPGAPVEPASGDAPSTVPDIRKGATDEPAKKSTIDSILKTINTKFDPTDESLTNVFARAANVSPEALVNIAILKAKNLATSKQWDTLSLQQRTELVEGVYGRFVQANHEADARLPFAETIAAWKAETLAPPVDPATVVPPVATAPIVDPDAAFKPPVAPPVGEATAAAPIEESAPVEPETLVAKDFIGKMVEVDTEVDGVATKVKIDSGKALLLREQRMNGLKVLAACLAK